MLMILEVAFFDHSNVSSNKLSTEIHK